MIGDSNGGPNPVRATVKAEAPKHTPVDNVIQNKELIDSNWIKKRQCNSKSKTEIYIQKQKKIEIIKMWSIVYKYHDFKNLNKNERKLY